MLSSFKKACTLCGPTSPYCVEFLRGWADHWIPYDFFFQVAKMILNPQQLLQWQMLIDLRNVNNAMIPMGPLK